MAGPASMNYDSLVSDVKSYLERPSDPRLDAQIPRLIMMAENRMATDLRILGTQAVVQDHFVAGEPTIAKPALWRKSISMRYQDVDGGWAELDLRLYEYIRQYWPDATVLTDAPRYYGDYNFNNFLVAGTPSTTALFELTFVSKLEPLSSANQVNWYTSNAPQLILNATLLEAEIWLKNQARVPGRQASYTESLSAFKGEDGARAIDRNLVLA